MSEGPASEKTPSLAEQWLQQDIEQADESKDTIEEKIKEDNLTGASSEVEKTDETPASEVTETENNEISIEEPTNSVVEETNEASEGQEAEEQEANEEKPEIKLETAPADFRFPTTNQSRHCFTRYIEYHRCIAAKGEGAPECEKFAKYYRSLCPSEWVERWNEQRENGTFPGPL